MTDDEGKPLVGMTLPRTVKIDGPLIMCDVEIRLETHHVVERLFRIKNASAEEVAELAETQRVIQSMSADQVLALNTMAATGATTEDLLRKAAELGIAPRAAPLVVSALMEMQKIVGTVDSDAARALNTEAALAMVSGRVVEAVKSELSNPVAGPSTGGSGVVSGAMGVNARITGEVVATLAPEGSVG